MLESLLPETRGILGAIEKRVGCKVSLMPDESRCLCQLTPMDVLAALDGRAPTITYNPKAKGLDCLIAHEGLRLLRYLDAAPEERYFLSSSKETERTAAERMADEVSDWPVAVQLISAAGFPEFYRVTLTQLSSMPADFWITLALHERHPALREQMLLGLRELYGKVHQCLDEGYENIAPRTVFEASNAMSAAMAQFLEERLGMEEFSLPYRGTRFEGLGKKLRRLNATDRGLAGDVVTADEWASELGFREWYGWVKVTDSLSPIGQ